LSFFQHISDIISLVLQAFVVAGPAGRQEGIANAVTIDLRLV
jgi:hypothetical protein